MSERRTAEIKLRIAPSEKAAWQAEADAEGVGLSELIRDTMNARRVQSGLAKVFDRSVFAERSEAATIELLDPDESQFQTLLAADTLKCDYSKVERKSWMFESRG